MFIKKWLLVKAIDRDANRFKTRDYKCQDSNYMSSYKSEWKMLVKTIHDHVLDNMLVYTVTIPLDGGNN
jgi:hypothetical protein